MLNKKAFAAAVSTQPAYIEDVFSTFLYTGNDGVQNINNGIALLSTAEWWAVKLRQNSSQGRFVTTDSSGNVYVTGIANDGSDYAFVVKYNASGTLQWQRKFREGNSYGISITTDSSNNVYVAGFANDGSDYAFVVKYNDSGTLQWQRKFRQTGTQGSGIKIDSSGNVYVTGYANDGSQYAFVVKYNSSGTLQWQRKLRQGSSQGLGIATDSSNNVYVTGYANDGSIYAFVAKYNSSGTLQWQRKFRNSGSVGNSVSVDSSNNVYATGYDDDGSQYAFVVKYNDSGTLQWQRKFRQNSSVGYGIATDSNGNVYVTGNANDGSIYAFVAKYNSSGTLQWQRKFRQGTSVGIGIATDSSGNVYVTGYANDGSIYAFILKINQDGSTVSGNAFVTMTEGTATDSAGTATDSAGTATDSAGTATDSAGTATDSAGTATSSTSTQSATVGKGGLTLFKGRSGATDWAAYDTVRGATFDIASNTTSGQTTQSTGLTSFNANGFSIGALSKINTNAATYASWTFAKQAKFFDVVTYTGNGSNRTIAHNLGSVPGCIFIKRIDTTADWQVYHRSLANTQYLVLNTTAAVATGATRWNSTTPTASVFSLGTDTTVNASGGSYVAYIFAHDAGGFNINGTENVISCGSYTGNGSATGPVVTLNYEPQWLLIKRSDSTSDWHLIDNMRGFVVGGTDAELNPNLSSAESTGTFVTPTATGFQLNTTDAGYNASGGTYIYVAIRRGPMRVPTSGTSVFGISARSGTGADATVTGGTRADDLVIIKNRGSAQLPLFASRLTGTGYLDSSSTAAEVAAGTTILQANPWDVMDGVKVGSTSAITNASSNTFVNYLVSRASGFFDVVCYTVSGFAANNIAHNLGATPELFITKPRGSSGGWSVYGSVLGLTTKYMTLNLDTSLQTSGGSVWGATSTTFSEPSTIANGNYVAILFASCPGVSKIGTYTGTGTTLAINCGFTGGARFVLIKRTDSSGDWHVWDTARGIVSGNDPYLLLNSTAAEVTTTDWIDPVSTGFELSSTAPAALNANGGTYIYLAIA